jgi:hypothetical protein
MEFLRESGCHHARRLPTNAREVEAMGRRTAVMPLGGGGTRFRPLLVLAGLAGFALVLHDPVGAAGTVEQVAAGAAAAVDALARFGSALAS